MRLRVLLVFDRSFIPASVVRSHDWSSAAQDYGLWLAGYPGNSGNEFALRGVPL